MKYEEVSVVDAREPVSTAISRLIDGEPCVVVTKNGEYLGIFSDLDVGEVIDTSKEKVETVYEKAPLLSEGMDVMEIVKIFLDGRYKALPIKTPNGYRIIRRNMLLKYLLEKNVIPKVTVGEIMNTPVYAVDVKDSIAKAREIMRKNKVRRVVVTDKGLLAGVIAMQDLIIAMEYPKDRPPFVREREGLSSIPVSNYMRTDVNVLPPNASIADAVNLLENSVASSVVIAEERRPLGIVSIRDILEIVAAQKEGYPIYISGIDTADQENLPMIKSTIERTFEKVKNLIGVEYLAIHYKKQRYQGLRSRYEVMVRLKSNKIISVSNADWDIRTATQGAMDELLSVVKKHTSKDRVLARERQRSKRRM